MKQSDVLYIGRLRLLKGILTWQQSCHGDAKCATYLEIQQKQREGLEVKHDVV